MPTFCAGSEHFMNRGGGNYVEVNMTDLTKRADNSYCCQENSYKRPGEAASSARLHTILFLGKDEGETCSEHDCWLGQVCTSHFHIFM